MRFMQVVSHSPRTIPITILVFTLAMWVMLAWFVPYTALKWWFGAATFWQLMIGTMMLEFNPTSSSWNDTEESWHRDAVLLASPAGIPYSTVKGVLSFIFLLAWFIVVKCRRLGC